jgi:hypothetical protein
VQTATLLCRSLFLQQEASAMSATSAFKFEVKSDSHCASDAERGARTLAGVRGILMTTGLLLGLATPVMADTLQISGAGLVRHCPCDFDAADDATVSQGVLQPAATNTHYFAPVVFPRDGETVCRFSMIYRDVNANDTMTATLNRKFIDLNGPVFDPPTVMARVKTAAGTPDTMRRASTKNIKSAKLKTNNSFYFIEAVVPTVNLEIVGFQIVVAPTCD